MKAHGIASGGNASELRGAGDGTFGNAAGTGFGTIASVGNGLGTAWETIAKSPAARSSRRRSDCNRGEEAGS